MGSWMVRDPESSLVGENARQGAGNGVAPKGTVPLVFIS